MRDLFRRVHAFVTQTKRFSMCTGLIARYVPSLLYFGGMKKARRSLLYLAGVFICRKNDPFCDKYRTFISISKNVMY
jgi:hypothetical protein